MGRSDEQDAVSAAEIRVLAPDQIDVLDRVDPDVFDGPVRREWAELFLADPSHVLVVAVYEGMVVGMGSGIVHGHPDKPFALFIDEVGVAQRMHRQGIGARIVGELLARGRALGCTNAWVATEVDNSAARALYSAVGGAEDPRHAVVYTWPLAADASAPDMHAPPEENHS